MPDLNGSFLGHAYGSLSLPEYNTESAAVAGSVGGTTYAYFFKFRTPSFSGVAESAVFSIPMYKGSGESATLRHAILTSDANATSYMQTTAAVSDTNQVSGTAGTVTFTGLGSETDYNSFRINTAGLKSSTVYYLVLWGYNSTGISIRQSGVEAWGSHAMVLSYKNTYTLSVSAGTGSTVTVKRGNTPLTNGATVTYGDVLTITFGAKTGYNLGEHTVNGTPYTSGDTCTVTGNVTVVATATKKTYTVTISAGTGVTITVKNGSTVLSSGAKVEHGTVLTVAYSYATGYEEASRSHDNGNHTVTDAVTFSGTAVLKKYNLTITAGTGTFVTVQRNGITLANGATISHFDVLTVQFGTVPGYKLNDHTVNGAEFASGGTVKVTGAVRIESSAIALAVRIGTGSGTERYFAYIGTGNGVELYAAYIGTGNGVEPYPGS